MAGTVNLLEKIVLIRGSGQDQTALAMPVRDECSS
jgi:hypothetical protein